MLAVKKNVFSAVLKLSKDGELRTEHGYRFHAAGPATMHVPRTLSSSAELQGRREQNDRVRPSTQELAQSSDKYTGASPCIALYIIRHSLNWMRCTTGSQCSRARIKPVTCEYFPASQSILPAAFITRCRRSRAYLGNPVRRLLQKSILQITKLLTKDLAVSNGSALMEHLILLS